MESVSAPGPKVIKEKKKHAHLSCAGTFLLLINFKMPTVVGILTFMSWENSIIGLSEPEKSEFLDLFILVSI